jgi:uncharacterized Zn finger protein (UPF0148 family)
MTMFSKHCPQCDGQDIFREAFATWDMERQEWSYDGDDAIHCPDCAYSGYRVVTKKIEHESVATEGDLS